MIWQMTRIDRVHAGSHIRAPRLSGLAQAIWSYSVNRRQVVGIAPERPILPGLGLIQPSCVSFGKATRSKPLAIHTVYAERLLPVTATQLPVGTYTDVVGTYAAYGNFAGSSSTPAQMFTVNPATSAAPVFTSPRSASFTSGESSTFLVTTTGNPIPAISFAPGSTPPEGVSITDNGNGTATLAGTSSLAAGVYPLTLQASNSAGTVDQPFTLNVTIPSGGGGPPTPSTCPFATPASKTVTAGQSFAFDVATASCWPYPSITGSGLPSWLTVTDFHDRIASLAATDPIEGKYDFTLTATNSVGSVKQQFKLVVLKEPPEL
jgi:hypothetical protein